MRTFLVLVVVAVAGSACGKPSVTVLFANQFSRAIVLGVVTAASSPPNSATANSDTKTLFEKQTLPAGESSFGVNFDFPPNNDVVIITSTVEDTDGKSLVFLPFDLHRRVAPPDRLLIVGTLRAPPEGGPVRIEWDWRLHSP